MTSFEIGFGNNLTNMEAPELLIAFRGTNFSRRTQPNPSQTHSEAYFAKSHPSVSPFSANKKYGADQDWVDFWDFAIGGWFIVPSPWEVMQHLPL